MTHEVTDRLIFSTVAERLQHTTGIKAVGEVATTAAGFLHPPRERLYRTTRTLLADDARRPLETLDSSLSAVSELLAATASSESEPLSTQQLTSLVNTMVQFSDRSGTAYAMHTPVENVSLLHQGIMELSEDGPVSYEDQLKLALSDTEHLPSALWNLMLTTRQYARWRDSNVIDGFEEPSKTEALEQMVEWERALKPIKNMSRSGYQDAAGDAYYVWTHALARVIYTALPEKPTAVSNAYATAFEYGSYAMTASSLLGRISVLGTMSNHIEASKYGNAIGDMVAEKVTTTQKYHE
jgi:hypothetical protein